jgi:hypothetical protein
MLAAVLVAAFVVVSGRRGAPQSVVVSGPCQFQKADQPASVALCETFDQPASPPTASRSPALSSLWGVSREIGLTNFGQGQYSDASSTTLQKCGQSVAVQPPNDVAICNGQLAEAVSDQHSVTSLAMYPKQPFDIAGRTGTIAFDVSDDSHGNHRAWPEVWYTDQPVPVPFDHFSSLQSVPKNGFGIRFAGYCPPGQLDCRILCPSIPSTVPVVTVDSAVVVNNYVSDDSFMDVGTGPISVKPVGCVRASSGPGNMNHFELRVSQHEIDVYGTDAGNTTGAMTELAVISNMTLTLTRGLVWMEDVHYNGDKDGPDQGTHTFTWDNVGFDGPTLPRDLAFDALDSLQPVANYPGLVNLGWMTAPTNPAPLSITVPGVYNIAGAGAGLLTFNFFSYNPVNLSYRVNNGAWQTQAWLFGSCALAGLCGPRTIALPVPLGDLQPGVNTVQFKSTDATVISNVDLVLAGAGGLSGQPTPPPTTTTASKSTTTASATTTTAQATTTTAQATTTTAQATTTTMQTTTTTASPPLGSGSALVTSSAGPGSNKWWLAEQADLALPSAVGSVEFEIHVKRTPGVTYTGGWSTLPGYQFAETTTATEVVCTYSSVPGTLRAGIYSFTCGVNVSGSHSMSADTWVFNTTAPNQTSIGPMSTTASPPPKDSDSPVVTSSAGPGSNQWWLADQANVNLPSAVGSLELEIHVKRTPGVKFTSGWSTLAGYRFRKTTTDSDVVCTFESLPGTVFAGTYTFTCGVDVGTSHPMSGDKWVLETTGPTLTSNGPM